MLYSNLFWVFFIKVQVKHVNLTLLKLVEDSKSSFLGLNGELDIVFF